MTTQQHTPGPWKIDNRGGETTISGVGKWLTTIHQDRETTTVQIHPNWKEADANARLIAAAPEMLQALKELTAFIRDYRNAVMGGDIIANKGGRLLENDFELARRGQEVINKAEGK